jgi:acyl-coenzyme A synthetase/AMP-(fatty) acid ligase
VIAVATLVPGCDADPERILAWAGERLERYKVPARLKVVSALPVGATGKGDRGAVARLFLEEA